ncbi:MAG: WYL domain-containing protein [Phocaeicola sp.]
MIFKYKFCLWLIDTLNTQPLTLPEIQKRWLQSGANEEGTPLSERTFNRYRNDAEQLISVDIKCDKRNGNLYKIIYPEGFKSNELQQWVLSAFRVSSLANRVNQREVVQIEPAPPAASLLQEIMEAIDGKHPIRFHYCSHYCENGGDDLLFIPAFVRLFRQRWYVLGEIVGEERIKICALERITGLEVVREEKCKISSSLQDLLSPNSYFEHCFGVIRQFEPITIRFRAFWPQDAYLRDVPIHTSQVEIERTNDYTDFEVYVRPTYDLKQELLWHRDKLAVLSPPSFKQEMIEVVKAMCKSYETGENYAIDE